MAYARRYRIQPTTEIIKAVHSNALISVPHMSPIRNREDELFMPLAASPLISKKYG